MNQLWKLGQNINLRIYNIYVCYYLAKGNLSTTKVLLNEVPLSLRTRATGPKTYHMGRTLVFVPPGNHSVLFEKKSQEQSIALQNRYTAQYHSHSRDVFIS